jgi:hypothetical protein
MVSIHREYIKRIPLFVVPGVSKFSGTADPGDRHPSRLECRRTCTNRRPEIYCFFLEHQNRRSQARPHGMPGMPLGRSRFSRCLSLSNTAVLWRRGTNTAVMLGPAAPPCVQLRSSSDSYWASSATVAFHQIVWDPIMMHVSVLFNF